MPNSTSACSGGFRTVTICDLGYELSAGLCVLSDAGPGADATAEATRSPDARGGPFADGPAMVTVDL